MVNQNNANWWILSGFTINGEAKWLKQSPEGTWVPISKEESKAYKEKVRKHWEDACVAAINKVMGESNEIMG